VRGILCRGVAVLTGLALAGLAVGAAEADRVREREQTGVPGWVLPGAALDLDFLNGRYWQARTGCRSAATCLTVNRAAPETSLLPTSASGTAYVTFAAGVAAVVPGAGLQIFEARTNYLLNSTAPATQTTASLGAGTYTLWVNGSGSATSSAGTATGTGFGAATQGAPNIFVLSGGGTVTVTVSGLLNAFQLENGNGGTPLIVTGGAPATRNGDFVTIARQPNFGSSLSAFIGGVPAMAINYGTTQTPLQIDQGDNNQRIDIDRNSNNGIIGLGMFVGGSAQPAPAQSVVWPTGGWLAIAYAVTVNDEAVASGGTLATTAGNTMFVPSRVVVGANGTGTHQWNGTIARLAIWPNRRLPNALLQQIAR
jgi:hypothetical protein